MVLLLRRWRIVLLAAVTVAVPHTTYAQFGGLANMAKAKAAEVLTNTVMKEIDKKIAASVDKKPISEADKAIITKKLSDMARPVVKKFVDGAASGNLPNPAELANTVMKDILPQLDGLVAAIAGATPAQPPAPQTVAVPAQPAPIPAPVPEQPAPVKLAPAKPKIAVYAFGANVPATNKTMADRLIAALDNSGRYQAAETYQEFFDNAAAEQKDDAAAIVAMRMQRLGRQFDVGYVCVAELTNVFGEYQAVAHILELKTATVTAMGAGDIPLKTQEDLAAASQLIVETMLKNAP